MPTESRLVARALRRVAERKRTKLERDGEPLWKPVMVSDLLLFIGEVAEDLDGEVTLIDQGRDRQEAP